MQKQRISKRNAKKILGFQTLFLENMWHEKKCLLLIEIWILSCSVMECRKTTRHVWNIRWNKLEGRNCQAVTMQINGFIL